MDVKDVIGRIEAGEHYKRWKVKHADAYLTSAFTMHSPEEKGTWLISYFDADSRKIATFSTDSAEESREEPFSKEGVEELKLEDVKVESDIAYETARKAFSDYDEGKPNKVIMVLQNLEGATLWNTTFITPTIKVLNVRISAVSGEILSHKVNSIQDYMQGTLQ